MQDVAALAGVSLKSVSRVVNREPGVSEELARRVGRAVAELGYRHNVAASNLRRRRPTASIGVLVQDLSNEFCSEVLHAIEERARDRGFVVLATSIEEDADRELAAVDALLARGIDGLLLMPATRDQSYLDNDRASGLAVVAVDRRPVVTPIDAVVSDNQGGAAEAVGHLVAHGHRRIAFLGDSPSIPTAVERRDGYRTALRASRLPLDPELERMGLGSRDDAVAVTHALLDLEAPPTALVAGRNVICTAALIALQERGLWGRVALVGFDEVAVAEVVDPRVTVVRQDTRAIGARAVDRLLARLGGDTSPPSLDVVATELVERGSGEITPA